MATLGMLAAGVAHDVNNLLTIIGNYAAFAATSDATEDRPDAERWNQVLRDLDQIQRAARRGSELTGRLLDYARPRPADTPLLVNDAIEETLELLRGALGRDVTVTTHFAADCRPIAVSRADFGQIMVNLVVNAVDAMPRGGTIDIRTETLTRSAGTGSRSVNGVRISVADSGPGIAPAILSRVFEPFFTTKSTGSGIGLAVVRDTVARAGGEVTIASDPGRGATVDLWFPETRS